MRRLTIQHGRMYDLFIAVVAATVSTFLNDSCFTSTETTLCEASGLRCPPGWTCSADQTECIQGGCGDGIKRGDEECDDGNTSSGDGCSANCKLEICGNGITDLHEECDGQSNCSADCHLLACGNGILDIGEVCDDGNETPDDGCSADCRSNEACGNGIVDNDRPTGKLHEDCDPKNLFPLHAEDTADCDSDCTFPSCGDGHVNTQYKISDSKGDHFEECDSGVSGVPMDSLGCDSDCTFVKCGDGHVNTVAGEECDDGSNNSNMPDSSCRKDCLKPFCGDSIIDLQHREQCDDGTDNSDTSDACRTNCLNPICGDGIIDTKHGEQCDDGMAANSNTPDACRTNCLNPICGDGVIDTKHGEQCDDGMAGNSNMPNACRPITCHLPSCGDGVIDDMRGEQCDPTAQPTGCTGQKICTKVGNQADPDGCSCI